MIYGNLLTANREHIIGHRIASSILEIRAFNSIQFRLLKPRPVSMSGSLFTFFPFPVAAELIEFSLITISSFSVFAGLFSTQHLTISPTIEPIFYSSTFNRCIHIYVVRIYVTFQT